MGSTYQSLKIVRKNGEVLPEAAIEQLKTSVKGEVLFKGEADEETYRKAIDRFNKATITEASIIVFVESEADIAAVLQYVQQWDLEFVISSGRHSYYGASSTTGLVIDLRKLTKVSVDVANKSVTAQGGCKAVHLEKPVAAEGYSVVFGAANDTGIGGLTLGGGSGLLTGQYGMVVDNLLAVRVVLADGRVLEASETINSDLFWGVRGGGSNFGVISEFTYRIHKQAGPVFSGPLVFKPDQIKLIIENIGMIKKIVDGANGKLAVFLAFVKLPGAPQVQPLTLLFYDGPEEEAKSILAPLYELGPMNDMAHMREYHTITDPNPLIDGPPTHQFYSASNLPLWSADDVDVLEAMVEDYSAFMEKYGDAVAVSKIAMEIRSHAKTSSVPLSATAYAGRRSGMATVIEAQYDSSVSPAVMREEVKAISDKAKAAMKKKHPDVTGAFNANIASGAEKSAELFGDNLPRLREVKKKYDPNFVFNKWYPIAPAA